MPSKLEKAREIINEVDTQMAELFVKRMRATELVYEHKKEYGLPILDQSREDQVIASNSARIEDDVLRGYYIDYLKNLMSLSRAYQYRMQSGLKVAYSGVEGAFAHIAAGRIFPDSARVSCRDFKSAYDAVVKGDCDVAVLPIENSFAGEVGQTIDLIFSGNLYINGIYELEIHQNLLGIPGATVEDIRKVTSHPQALSQCHDYIKLRGFDAEEASNTAVAAKMVAERQDKTLGAIASVETAEIYGLKVLEAELSERIKQVRRELEKLNSRTTSTDHFLSTVRQYTRAKKLTPRMLNELIDRIEVHQAEKIDGEWVQKLTIHYNCIGALFIPDTDTLPVPDVTVNTRRGVYVTYEPAQNEQ